MKTPEDVVVDVTRRVSRTWAVTLARPEEDQAWPHQFPIGQPARTDLEREFGQLVTVASQWRAWAREHPDCPVTARTRVVGGTHQQLPTHVHVPTVHAAAALAGGPWPEQLRVAAERVQVLTQRYPHVAGDEKVLTWVTKLTGVDFDLTCQAADWFARNRAAAAGLTPRQVPLAGVHAKWLNTGQHVVAALAGLDRLDLAAAHPPRIHFTYLDPVHRAGGGRVHDSATLGDQVTLPYLPRVVLICENKDTAIHFPALPGGVAVEGGGRGPAAVAALKWIVNASVVLYWGDIDPDGLEILNDFRAAGVPARSLLMDERTYEQWSQYGTHTDARGAALEQREPRPVKELTEDEARLYRRLCGPDPSGPRRLEQERIPLHVACESVLKLLGETAAELDGES